MSINKSQVARIPFLGKKTNMNYFPSFTYFCMDPKLWMTLKNICPIISTLIFRFGKEPIDRARLDLVFLFYLFQQIEVKRYFFRFENYVTVPESCPRGLGRLLCHSLAKSDVHTCVFFVRKCFHLPGVNCLEFLSMCSFKICPFHLRAFPIGKMFLGYIA